MRIRKQMLQVVCAGAVVALLLPCNDALATGTPVTANIIEVTATSGSNSATFTEVFPVTSWSGLLAWNLPAPEQLSDGAVDLALLSSAYVGIDEADPVVDLDFSLTNSTSGVLFVNIKTAVIQFGANPNAEASAISSMTLGDSGTDGVWVGGQFADAKCYEASYSTSNVANTNTNFARLLPSLNFNSPGGMGSENLPAWGMSSLGTTVYMMQAEYKFTLSPGDQVSGESSFVIIPEPATVAMLALGGLLLLRRREAHRVL